MQGTTGRSSKGGGIESNPRSFKEALSIALSWLSKMLAEGTASGSLPEVPGSGRRPGQWPASSGSVCLSEGGTDFGAPPPPHTGPAPGTEERRVVSGWRTAVWMAGIKVPSSMEGWGEEGLSTFAGPRCSADEDRGRYWPLKWALDGDFSLSRSTPHPRGAGSEEGGDAGFHTRSHRHPHRLSPPGFP